MTIGTDIFCAKGVDLKPLETSKITTEFTIVCLRENLGKKLKMVFTVLQFTPLGTLEVILCLLVYRTVLRTGNPVGTYQNGYNTYQYGSNVPK